MRFGVKGDLCLVVQTECGRLPCIHALVALDRAMDAALCAHSPEYCRAFGKGSTFEYPLSRQQCPYCILDSAAVLITPRCDWICPSLEI